MQLHADELRSCLEPLFRENFEKFGELGAAISVWQNGKELLELHGGFREARREQPWTDDTLVLIWSATKGLGSACLLRREQPWTDDTLVLIWSATKGLGSACLLHVLQEHKIDIERRVGEFWPEFAQAGKENITLGQLLSHQAGLAALDRKVDVLDHAAVVDALAKQEPNWPPGTAHGYHARTFGFLLDELVRRISGTTLGEYWRKAFADPLGLDLWIGLPEHENGRVATMYAARAGKPPEPAQFYRDVAKPGTFAHKVFGSPHGLNAVSAMNKPEIRAQAIVSFGGIGNASALARFYALLANGGCIGDREFFSKKTIGRMTTTLTDGVDRVFQIRRFLEDRHHHSVIPAPAAVTLSPMPKTKSRSPM